MPFLILVENGKRGAGGEATRKFLKRSLFHVKVDFHLHKIFRGQERNGTEKLVSMHVCHVNRKIFLSVPVRGKFSISGNPPLGKHNF